MPATQKELISVVMPVYGEASHIGDVLADVRSRLEEAGEQFEFVLIDDGSPDKTWAVLEAEAAKHPMLRAARLSRNFGKELALTAGLDLAQGGAVIVMDADGQHPPALLPAMISAWREKGVDIVEAVKSDRGKETLLSKFGAGLFYSLWSRFSGFDIRAASDFKLLSRRAVDAYLQMDERNVFFRGMTAWLGFERVQIPFEVASRAGGQSNWSVFKKLSLAVNGISGFSSIPLQLVTFVGIAFLLFSIVFGVYTLALQITGHSVSGFATVILLLLIIGSLLMISLGIIGIYLARIYDEIKRRPRYLVSNRIETKE